MPKSLVALRALRQSFARSLRARNKAHGTIESYGAAADLFIRFLEDPPHAEAAELINEYPVVDEIDVRRAHIEAFIAHVLSYAKPRTAELRFTGLQQWFNWMAGEPDIDLKVSPMLGMERPYVPEQDTPIVPTNYIKAILATCDPKTFAGLRDSAIIHLFCDTGVRLGELAGLNIVPTLDGVRVPCVDLDACDVYVMGKGRRPRTVSFGATTAVALDRYVRKRAKHPYAARPELWLPIQRTAFSTLSGHAIWQMIARRANRADIPHIHPHQLRHTWADGEKRIGLSEEDLMRQGGWRSERSARRYGAAAADERAREAHRRRSFMDSI